MTNLYLTSDDFDDLAAILAQALKAAEREGGASAETRELILEAMTECCELADPGSKDTFATIQARNETKPALTLEEREPSWPA